MSVESFIRALPKIELSLRFEGAVKRETMLMFADQNEIRSEVKKFDKVVEKYQDVDFKKLDETLAAARSWIRYADDLARAVYDIGVRLSKDNVRFAEIAINPTPYVTGNFTFEDFIKAINDGRDRVERAWSVQLRWIMVIPRDDPRWADDIARWTTSATARKGGVVALAISGYDKRQSLDAFERPFRLATKKNLARIAYLSAKDDIYEAIDQLHLDTIVDGWGIWESPETLELINEQQIALYGGSIRSNCYGWAETSGAYPFTQLTQQIDNFVLTSDMPVIFGGNLSDEYLIALESGELSVEQIESLILRSIANTHLPEEEKETMATIFQMEFEILREEHLREE